MCQRRLVAAQRWLVIALLVVILAAMGGQVIARYVFRSPLWWSEEVARLALVWLTFIAAGFVMARGEHIVVDLFGPTALGKALRRLAASIVLVACLTLLLGGSVFVVRVYPAGSPGIGVSKTYWYGAASVGLALMALQALFSLLGMGGAADAVERGEVTEQAEVGPS